MFRFVPFILKLGFSGLVWVFVDLLLSEPFTFSVQRYLKSTSSDACCFAVGILLCRLFCCISSSLRCFCVHFFPAFLLFLLLVVCNSNVFAIPMFSPSPKKEKKRKKKGRSRLKRGEKS